MWPYLFLRINMSEFSPLEIGSPEGSVGRGSCEVIVQPAALHHKDTPHTPVGVTVGVSRYSSPNESRLVIRTRDEAHERIFWAIIGNGTIEDAVFLFRDLLTSKGLVYCPEGDDLLGLS